LSDEQERAGLGKVVYSVDEEKSEEAREEEREARKEVEEAAKESFPASDPPGYAGGSTTDEG
jgi:hypothetical protein